MERFQELRDVAKKKITIADHMLTITYPMVNDIKLLLAVLENVFLALTNAMSSVLYYERLFKRIPPFTDNFESKFHFFKEKCASKYGIDTIHVSMIRDIRDIIVEHKKSPMGFIRKDRFVICTDNYHMKTIDVSQIKKYITDAKIFIEKTSIITSKHEGIFK